jgi:hypothetical protein
MCCYRSSLVFYDVVILLVVILLVPVVFDDCSFADWSYQFFHLRNFFAISRDLSVPIFFFKQIDG